MQDIFPITNDSVIRIIFALLGLLGAFWIVRYKRRLDKIDVFDSDFKEFRTLLNNFTEELWDKDRTFNRIILDNYKVHVSSKNKFFSNLPRGEGRRLEDKWEEYKRIYERELSLERVFAIASEAPPHIDISEVTEHDIISYDYEKRKAVHKLLDEILDVAYSYRGS